MNQKPMNSEGTLLEPAIPMEGKLRLLSLYLDYAAALRARQAAHRVTRLAGKSWKVTAEMWDLNSLTAGNGIRKLILQGAADSDVLIVTMSSLARREAELVQWLDEVAAVQAQRAASGLLIGLLGDEENRAGELDWTVKQFRRCARQMDRDFSWYWMEAGVTESSDWLADSVAALLGRKQPVNGATCWQESIVGAA